MKKVSLIALLLVSFLVSAPMAARADETADASMQFSNHLADDYYRSDGLWSYLEDKSSFSSISASELETYATAYSSSADYYSTACAKVESALTAVCDHAKSVISQLTSGISSMKTETTFAAGLDQTKAAISELDTVTLEHDEALGLYDSGPLYILGTIIFSIISLILFFKSRIKGTSEAATMKREIMKGLFRDSLWPTFGALISALWYLFSTDGSELVMFGPILIGGFYFLKSVIIYFKEQRKALNQQLRIENSRITQ